MSCNCYRLIFQSGNLTAGGVIGLCEKIQEALTKEGAVPKECEAFVGPQMTWFDRKDSNITLRYWGMFHPLLTFLRHLC